MQTSFISKSKPADIFEEAEEYMRKKYPPEQLIKKREDIPKVIVPMPDIRSNPNVEGPLGVSKEYYIKKTEKRKRKREKEAKECEREMIQLIARRDRLRQRLNDLDPGKKKDSKKIASINIDLKNIKSDLEMLSSQSGIELDEIEKGSKFGRFMSTVKRKINKGMKKFHKFCRNNGELVGGALSVAFSVVGSLLVRAIFKL